MSHQENLPTPIRVDAAPEMQHEHPPPRASASEFGQRPKVTDAATSSLETAKPSDAAGRLRACDFDVFVRLDQIAGLEVLEIGQTDAALEALSDLACVVLETAQ